MALIIAITYFLLLSVGTSLWLRKKVKSGSDFVTGGGTVAWPLVAAGFVLAPLGSGHTLSLWESSADMGAAVLWWAIMSGGIFVPLFLLWFGPWFRRLQVQTFPEGMGKIFGEKIGWMISAVFPAQLIGICIAEVSATAAALFGMECVVYMGEEDIRRQAPNVQRMRFLGARVQPVSSGTATLKDAMSEAMRAWVSRVDDTFYVIGTVAGPHPYPAMVRDFQSVIGREAREQALKQAGRLPDLVLACVGGGSNAAGMFFPFLDDASVRLVGVEAAGYGIATGKHAASIGGGQVGILHGSKSYVLQDGDGQVLNAHSISAGLDYPGVGPEHALWARTGRVKYVSITDAEALEAFEDLTRLEGIIPALESSHAVAEAKKLAATLPEDGLIAICLSGRGDKDLDNILAYKAKESRA